LNLNGSGSLRTLAGIGALVAAGLIVGFALGAGTAGGDTTTASPRPTPSPSLRPSPSPSPSPSPTDDAVGARAVVVPNRQAELAMAVSGTVAQLLVAEDDEVRQGQLLLRLDDSTRRAAVAVARADVTRAEAAVERARILLDQVLPDDPASLEAAQAELRLAEAEALVARSALDAANTAILETELRAPFGGTIVAVATDVGEVVEAGAPLVTLADLSDWFIETTDLDELDVVRIAVGDRAVAELDALPGVQLSGTVERIQVRGATAEGSVRFSVLIRPAQSPAELRWNMNATVRILPSSEGD
jgi:RND family efflux transporter MFP subunit